MARAVDLEARRADSEEARVVGSKRAPERMPKQAAERAVERVASASSLEEA